MRRDCRLPVVDLIADLSAEGGLRIFPEAAFNNKVDAGERRIYS